MTVSTPASAFEGARNRATAATSGWASAMAYDQCARTEHLEIVEVVAERGGLLGRHTERLLQRRSATPLLTVAFMMSTQW
jgi:hypothetical protein